MPDISQITIFLKGSEEGAAARINEVALFSPLSLKATFDEENKTIGNRKWTFQNHLSLTKRAFLKIQTFFFHQFPQLVKKERKTAESKFKTVLAILLAQEDLRDFFFQSSVQKQKFFEALQRCALTIGYSEFKPSDDLFEMTTLGGSHKSLLEDPYELSRQMASLKVEERNEILFLILNQIERPPVTSVLEITREINPLSIELTTKYARVSVHKIDAKTGRITFDSIENQTTSSVLAQGAKGVMDQRLVFDQEGKVLGSYSGELLTSFRVLEQLLFLLKEEEKCHYFLLDKAPPLKIAEDKPLVFTSLFSWNELAKLQAEHEAIEKLHNKVLKIVHSNGTERILRLKLYHHNISFSALNKFPTPGEVKASLHDIQDAFWIQLLPRALQLLNLKGFEAISALAEKIDKSREEEDYLKKQKGILDAIDAYQPMKKPLIEALASVHSDLAHSLSILLDKSGIAGIDSLIYTSWVMKTLKVLHHKNCALSTDKTAAANAADKAQHAFFKIKNHPFLPAKNNLDECKLFQVLYSMYLVWEEPELNTGLSTGFIGEKYFNNFIQRNSEATKYLIGWLKAHPKLYLGLSRYR